MEEPQAHYKMDLHSVMETFAEAWVAANTHTPLTVAAEQGLINGPNNHAPPNHPLSIHPISSQTPPGHSVSSHTIPGHLVSNRPTPGHPVSSHTSSGYHVSSHTVLGHPISSHVAPGHVVSNCISSGHPVLSHSPPGHPISNHSSPGHPISSHSSPGHPVSNHSSPGPQISSHTPPQLPLPCHPLQIPNNHHTDNDHTEGALVPMSPGHNVQPVVCLAPEHSSDHHKDPKLSSEEQYGKVPEHHSDDVPSNGSNLTEMQPITISKTYGKSLPVHCIVEQIPGPQSCGQHVELDSYAIVPSNTLFNDLVRTALGKLGYSTTQILGAKGSIQIKKWKPLAFDQITENPEATVAHILGELTTVATLHVRLYSVPDDPKEWQDVTVRNAVLELLREMSQIKLAKLCPLSQPMLSNIINNRYLGKIGKEKCQEFGLWYLNYRKQNPEGTVLEVVPSDRPADGRLTFHPTKELPQMREWFHTCRNPSSRTLQLYVDILNKGPVRQQERPKVVLSTLKNWWKNEKQRERKQQRDDEKVDDPRITRKRRKRGSAPTTDVNTKDSSSEQTALTTNAADPQIEEMKSNNFTLINHSENENESDSEKMNKKECDMIESLNLSSDTSISFAKSNLTEADRSGFLSGISYPETSRDTNGMLKDYSMHESSSLLPATKTHGETSIFHKIHSVCGEHNHNLFPYSEPHLSINNCSKVFCENSQHNRKSKNNDCSPVSSEEDVVDVVCE